MNNFTNSALKNIVCLDIINANKKDLSNWFLINNNYEEITKDYVYQTIEKNKAEIEKSNKIAHIFLHDSFCVATANEDNLNELELVDTLLNELKELPTIKTGEMKKEIDYFMTNLIEKNRMKMSEIIYFKLHNYINENLNPIQYKIPFFFEDIVCFEMYPFNLKMFEIIGSKNYKPVHNYLRSKYPNIKILDNFIVQKMYYLKNLFVACSGKVNGTDEEVWFWSDQYRELLFYTKTIYVNENQTLSIDQISNKVMKVGMDSLAKEELEILNSNF